KACLRCHRRKQRCVGFPACTNCRAADLPCSRDSTPSMRRLAGLSKEDLLKKIEALEEQLPAAERHAENRQDSPAHFSSRRRLSVSSTFSETLEPQMECDDGNDLQTLQAGEENLEQPDSSQISPTPVSLCLDSGVRTSQVRTAVEPQDPPTVHFGGTRDLNERTGSQLLVTYLESMHRRLPFCDYAQILMTLRGGVTPSSASTPMNLFRLYMACAIGAAIRKLTGTSHSAHPEQYFLEASKIRESLKNGDMVEEIEATFWTVLYKLRSSFSSEVWYLIGLAMRTAVEVGLHREHYYEDLDPKQADLHRRLFWAVYIIERNVCWSLKRPFSISDHDIDTNLPLPGINPTYLKDRDDHTSDVQGGSRRPLDLNIFIATIKLSRINAKIYTQLYRVDEARSALDQIPSLLHEIRQFEASLPKYSPPDHDFLQLHINNAVRALIEPSLPTLDPSDYLARRCLEASGGVCQFFKRLRLKRCLGYSFTMLNSVFIAGTTICISYIIFKDPTLWTPARSNDLRACSSSLFAAAERNSAVRKYCDALETIIEVVMEHVEKLS
ncbi:fungal-specific transcription factor domain-containing protein, partial [Ilyonectria sp. MPI-CAGE-AT-0026]